MNQVLRGERPLLLGVSLKTSPAKALTDGVDGFEDLKLQLLRFSQMGPCLKSVSVYVKSDISDWVQPVRKNVVLVSSTQN